MLNKQELAKFSKLVDTQDFRVSLLFKVLSDPNRCKIFRLVLKNKSNDLCVSDFAQILKISPAAASQHLKLLEITGVLIKERKGQKVCFRAQTSDALVNAVTKAIA